MKMDELVSSYFKQIREEKELQEDPFETHSTIKYWEDWSERFITLPNAVRIEWETYTPEQQAKVLSKMKDLEKHHRLVISHLRKMDKALKELSWARDNLGDIIPPSLREHLNSLN